jgi:hypothetical protein
MPPIERLSSPRPVIQLPERALRGRCSGVNSERRRGETARGGEEKQREEERRNSERRRGETARGGEEKQREEERRNSARRRGETARGGNSESRKQREQETARGRRRRRRRQREEETPDRATLGTLAVSVF